MQTEIEFTLPRGYVDAAGQVHRQGAMRLATALDEISVQADARARANEAYIPLLLLSRVTYPAGRHDSHHAGRPGRNVCLRLRLSARCVPASEQPRSGHGHSGVPALRRPVPVAGRSAGRVNMPVENTDQPGPRTRPAPVDRDSIAPFPSAPEDPARAGRPDHPCPGR